MCKLVGCPAYDGTERQVWFRGARNVALCDREYLLEIFSLERMGNYEYAYPRAHPINIITAAYTSNSLSAPREQTPKTNTLNRTSSAMSQLRKFHTKCSQDRRSTCALGSTNSVNRRGSVVRRKYGSEYMHHGRTLSASVEACWDIRR